MRRLCVVLIFFLILSVASGQSRISGVGNHATDGAGASYDQLEPPIRGNAYPGNLPEFSDNHSNQSFQPGVIITKDGDTLGGLIKYGNPVPFDKVSYKANELGPDSLFSVQEIKSLITQSVYMANIPFAGKEKLMPWLSAGKINLYFYQKFYGTGFTEGIYVLEKNNQLTYINKKDFKVMMRHVFFDVPDLLKKLGKKGYRFEDLVGIVNEYNKRFQ